MSPTFCNSSLFCFGGKGAEDAFSNITSRNKCISKTCNIWKIYNYRHSLKKLGVSRREGDIKLLCLAMLTRTACRCLPAATFYY